MKQLKLTKRPVVLTVEGKPEAVLQDTKSYRRLLDIAASADVHEAIRQGPEDVAHGRTSPAHEVFSELRLPAWNNALPAILRLPQTDDSTCYAGISAPLP